MKVMIRYLIVQSFYKVTLLIHCILYRCLSMMTFIMFLLQGFFSLVMIAEYM